MEHHYQNTWLPFNSLSIQVGNYCLVKDYLLPQNWFVAGFNGSSSFGPYNFKTAVNLITNLTHRQDVDESIIPAIGEFEAFKDALRLQILFEPLEKGKDLNSSNKRSNTHRIIQGITLSPGNSCSASCDYCYAKPRFKSLSSSTKETILIETFEFIRNHPIMRPECGISLGGGGDPIENFRLYLKAIELSKHYRKEYGINVPIYLPTIEPSFLNEDVIDTILENQSWITLSVDGDPDKIYHRPKVNFKRFVQAYGSRCKWGASAVFTSKTVSHIKQNYEYLLDAGFHAIQMRPARLPPNHPLHLNPKDYEVAVIQYRELIAEFLKTNTLADFLCRLSSADSLGHFFLRYLTEIPIAHRCAAAGAGGLGAVFVDPLGQLFPCPSVTQKSNQIGDIQSKIIDMSVIDRLHQKPTECKKCQIVMTCGGVCAYESILFSGSIGNLDPTICEYQRKLSNIVVDCIQHFYNTQPSIMTSLLSRFANVAFGISEAP